MSSRLRKRYIGPIDIDEWVTNTSKGETEVLTDTSVRDGKKVGLQ